MALIAAAIAAATTAGAASAQVVISDNFDADTYAGSYGANYAGDPVFSSFSPPGNAPNPASVSLVGAGTAFPFASAGSGHGLFIDLNGAPGSGNMPAAGALISNAVLAAGSYRVTFDLAGNQQGGPAETTALHVVDFQPAGPPTITQIGPTITPYAAQPFTSYAFNFTTSGGHLTIGDEGLSNGFGNLVDNIVVASVPEPATWLLMIAGFGLVGVFLRLPRRSALAIR